jgi:hypothetical protein
MASTVIPIWPGSASFAQVYTNYYVSGQWPPPTPFGFYDNDPQFQTDANKVSNFCALHLGYPIENVELQQINFFAAFEEAVTVYGNELYAFQLRDNYLSLEGASTLVDVNDSIFTPTFSTIVRLSQQYGEEAGAGGNVTWFKGQLELFLVYKTMIYLFGQMNKILQVELKLKMYFTNHPQQLISYIHQLY